jgi:CBS domain containing-hemolysin-like protein
MEEIVGRVGEEVRGAEPEYHEIDAHTFQVDGSARIDEINEALELGLPEGDYETVAGFLLSELGHIPSVGEQVRYNDLRLSVEEMDGVKVAKVVVTRS